MREGFSLEGVSFSYQNSPLVLNDIHLQARFGEHIAIIGPSGSGKTTLLHLLATAIRPQVGTVKILGRDPWLLSKRQLRFLRTTIGLIHQAPPLPPKQRVITAILAGKLGQWSFLKSLRSLFYPVDIAGPKALLDQLELSDRLFDRCDRLSGGQLQRVGVARVLYQDPQLILADEPVSAMDPVLSDLTVQKLSEHASLRGISLLASLHDVKIAKKWFPRIVGVRDGKIMFDVPTSEVSQDLLTKLYATDIKN